MDAAVIQLWLSHQEASSSTEPYITRQLSTFAFWGLVMRATLMLLLSMCLRRGGHRYHYMVNPSPAHITSVLVSTRVSVSSIRLKLNLYASLCKRHFVRLSVTLLKLCASSPGMNEEIAVGCSCRPTNGAERLVDEINHLFI